tara:strand:+ start:4396 stop:5343 length:948 start_codon:yes stop_codon:yes gene_type:complete
MATKENTIPEVEDYDDDDDSKLEFALFPSDDDKKKKVKKKKPTVKKGKAVSKLDKPKTNSIKRGPRPENVSDKETPEVTSTKFLAGMEDSLVGEGGSAKLNLSNPPKPLTNPVDFMSKNVSAKKEALEKYRGIGKSIRKEFADSGAEKVTEEMRDRFNKAKESYNRNKLTREEKAFDQQERMKREETPTLFNYTSKDLREMENPPIEFDDKGGIKKRPFNPAEKLIRQREERLKKIREYKKAVRERNKFDPAKKDSEGKTRQQRYDDQFGGQPFGRGTILSQYSGESNLDRRMKEKIDRNELEKKARAKKIENIK